MIAGVTPIPKAHSAGSPDAEFDSLLEDILAANEADAQDIKILLVDDELDILSEMFDYLAAKGFNCETAGDAQAAIGKIEADLEIAVLLTDVSMPGMDGLQLVKQLRESVPADRVLEAIILTGHGGRSEAIEALQSGVMDFLTKPVSLKELAHTATRAVEAVRAKYTEARYKEALKTALQKEQKLNELQREFVSMVSHEFRTPLAIIDGTAQRILRRKDEVNPEELERRSKKIRNAVARMTELIDSTLYASRMDAGKIQFAPQPCDLARLVQEICSRQAGISPDHEIEVACGDLPISIDADPKLLDQVFTNLLSNAVKYSPNSSTIDVKCYANGGDVFVSVTDQGVGIPAAEMDHMFERYFRASTSTGIAGTGIGLDLVKRLVEMHSGEIYVDSTEGQGSTFTVRLPNEDRNEIQAPTTEAPPSPHRVVVTVVQQGTDAS